MAQIISASSPETCINSAVSLYKETFPEDNFDQSTLSKAFAPGRVNLIGGHTDYCQGFVLPLALSVRTYLVGKFNSTDDDQVSIVTSNIKAPNNKYSFSLNDVRNGNEAAKITDKTDPFRWANYVMGVVSHFHGSCNLKKGFNLAIYSEVPLGGGVSSSASIEVGVYTFLENLTGDIAKSKAEKALNCQKAEHTYPGMPCGIMDQFISARGQKDQVLLIDCHKLDETRLISFTDKVPVPKFLISNTNVDHELASSEYPKRRDATIKAAKECNKESLRYTSMDELNKALEEQKIDQIIYNRAKHVINECARTLDAAAAIENGDYNKVGDLMHQAHDSLAKLYEVSCPESDFLVECLRDQNGVFGSRMVGGGFGGCTVSIIDGESDIDSIIEKTDQLYFEKFGRKATFYVSGPSEGAGFL